MESNSANEILGLVEKLSTRTATDAILPDAAALTLARNSLFHTIPSTGLGLPKTSTHIQQEILPALNASSVSPRYYGFVTGGVTPAASYADHIVTITDQNVGAHLPDQSIATDVEDAALKMLCSLLDLVPDEWTHRILTTGATASNVLGLACGREYIVSKAGERHGKFASIAEQGILRATEIAQLSKINILTTVPHSSLGKAASLVGLGHQSIIDVGLAETPHRFDLNKLRKYLEEPNTASIVVISCAEVNTGLFATNGLTEMQKIRNLCNVHGAWIHVDGGEYFPIPQNHYFVSNILH
jgi:glutamate/tyrosine decarboxylase-like PLP-dependent enzyme